MLSKRIRSKRLWLVAEVLGWLGAVAIMAAYLLVSFGALSSDSALYHLLNLGGALGILIIATVKHVRQSVIVNIFWAAIAAVALVRIIIS